MKLLDITPTLSIRKSFKVEQENPASVVLDIMASLVEQDIIPKNKNMGDKILNIWG